MSKQQELQTLLSTKIIPDINEYLDELFELISAKKDTPSVKEEVKEMQSMKLDFLEILDEIKDLTISEEECEEIINELESMKQE